MKGVLQKIENISLFLWLLLIPTQLGKFFWPDWAMVVGIRSDYLAPVVYLSDLVWVVWMGSGVINSKLKTQNLKRIVSFENLLIIIFIGLNILVAGNQGVAIYKWLRVGQWVITFNKLKTQTSKLKTMLGWIIPCWIITESLLGLAQIVKGGSLEGIWYWLGERRFTLTTIGVAQMSVWGNGLIRAYGTFSHPNSLAGFLLISLLMWERNQKHKTQNAKLKRIWYWIVVWLGMLGIIIAGSRTIWMLLIIVLIYKLRPLLGKKKIDIKNLLGYMAIGGGVLMLIIGLIGTNYRVNDFLGGWDSDSLGKRVSLNMVAIRMWKENFMLGVGAGNFIAELPSYQGENKFYWMQPVHNIFLLAGAEIGILGIVLIIYKISDFRSQIMRKRSWLILGIIVVTGMIDHYWVTLPQNMWLLAVVLAVL